MKINLEYKNDYGKKEISINIIYNEFTSDVCIE